ncbi:hypothetical protein [Streptomyces aidingensis]|uniref:Uncharacterized protein n=1 Tax=Streptomyces aidingensis TaxID=910347 RepID=A0A1I1IIA1_9ACTN|nr:hypothetical protein [Streptomyces aidingensis]SFC35977.1 hypothetical protein SAMN05421773_10369 [Streptomyces aidingensis]
MGRRPLPFSLGGRGTDLALRQTYFTPAAGRALYGTPERPCRWHRITDLGHGPVTLDGIELLSTATVRQPASALAILHLTVRGPRLLDTLRALGGRYGAPPSPLHGPLAPERLLRDIAGTRPQARPFALARPYTLAFLTPRTEHTPALRDPADGPLPEAADMWLWQLASRSNSSDYPLPPEELPRIRERALRISADWSALILRHGAAFLGHRADGEKTTSSASRRST